jgi:hypothetical protein
MTSAGAAARLARPPNANKTTTAAPNGAADTDAEAGAYDDLRATCGGRELVVRRSWHPQACRDPRVVGFWSMLIVQELLPFATRDVLAVDLWWRGAHVETLRFRISPVAAHLARAYPLNLDEYPVPRLCSAEGSDPHGEGGARDGPRPPTLLFPGLGAVGGASLNQLMRRKILHDGGALPVHFEADNPALWERARAADRRVPRWIDGHACHGAAERLATPFARVTLLRDPAVRLLSIYNYNALVHPYDFPFATVDEFLASDAVAGFTQAASLLRIAGEAVDAQAPADELYARARAELRRSYALVGVTELFEETIFLLCQLGGHDAIGMWWKVLSAPGRPDATALAPPARRRLETLVAADRRLHDDARIALEALVATRALGAPLARYKADAAAATELPDVYKLVECLRWRQVLGDAELRALRAAAGPQ